MSLNRPSTVLFADAAFCFLCGLPGLFAPAWLASFLLPSTPTLFGWPMRDVMLEAGVLLALYGAIVCVAGLRAASNRTVIGAFVLADALWVLGTLLLLASGALSAWGAAVLLVVAADTALLGWLKLRLLRGGAIRAAA